MGLTLSVKHIVIYEMLESYSLGIEKLLLKNRYYDHVDEANQRENAVDL